MTISGAQLQMFVMLMVCTKSKVENFTQRTEVNKPEK